MLNYTFPPLCVAFSLDNIKASKSSRTWTQSNLIFGNEDALKGKRMLILHNIIIAKIVLYYKNIVNSIQLH